jgi:hypothetical protein
MQDAIAYTWETLAARVRNYKFGAFASLAFAFLLLIAAVFIRSGWLLACLPLLYLIGYVFAFRDVAIVTAWEERILSGWEKPDFFMGIFSQSMANHPTALNASLKSMIRLLPPDPDNRRPTVSELLLYRRVCATRAALQRLRLQRAGLRGLLLAVIPVFIWLGIHSGWRTAAYGLVTIPVGFLALAFANRRAWNRWRERTNLQDGATRETHGTLETGAAQETDAAREAGTAGKVADLAAAADALDWKGIPKSWKDRFRAAMTGPTAQ